MSFYLLTALKCIKCNSALNVPEVAPAAALKRDVIFLRRGWASNMASRLEINFIRLLSRCESIASEKRGETEWRLEKVRREAPGVGFIFIALHSLTLKGLLLFAAAVSHVVTEASQHDIVLLKFTTHNPP